MTNNEQINNYQSKIVKANVTVIGVPNFMAWATKANQVYNDVKANRYTEKGA